jgi:hypothetical protein
LPGSKSQGGMRPSALETVTDHGLTYASLPRRNCRYLSGASCRHVGSDAPMVLEESSGGGDGRWSFHADHGPPAGTLRPPPSESRPTHRGPDSRHGPRSSSLDAACLAGREGVGGEFAVVSRKDARTNGLNSAHGFETGSSGTRGHDRLQSGDTPPLRTYRPHAP